MMGMMDMLCPLAAQVPPPEEQAYAIRHIGQEAGLSEGHVFAIFQDHLGFMWFGTRDGLNRYDGYETKVYRNRANDPNSLSDNYVYSIMEDNQKNLWIGTRNGLNRFDRKTGGFQVFHQEETEQGLSRNVISGIVEGPAGFLWVGSDAGLARFDPSDGSFLSFRYDENHPNGQAGVRVAALYVDPDGKNLWLGDWNGTVARMTFDSGHFQLIPLPDQVTEDIVWAMVRDKAGTLWLASNGGLCRLVEGLQPFFQLEDRRDASPRKVEYLAADAKGFIWGQPPGRRASSAFSLRRAPCGGGAMGTTRLRFNPVLSVPSTATLRGSFGSGTMASLSVV